MNRRATGVVGGLAAILAAAVSVCLWPRPPSELSGNDDSVEPPQSAHVRTWEPPHPAAPAPGEGVPVRVHAGDASLPIADCRVSFTRHDTGETGERITHSEGVVFLPAPGRYALRARAGGFVRTSGWHDVGVEGVTLRLARAGDLTLRFVDERGGPVAGIEAVLLPPIAEGCDWDDSWKADFSPRGDDCDPPDEGPRAAPRAIDRSPRVLDAVALAALSPGEWRRESSAEGEIRWRDLAPSEGYRWGLLSSGTAVDIRPEHEIPEVVLTETGVLSDGARPPPGLSGRVVVEAGAETEISIDAFRTTEVHGRIAGPSGGRSSLVVKLFDVTRYGSDSGPAAVQEKLEAHVTCDATGAFRFRGVKPGEKILRCSWREPRNQVHFAASVFDLMPGESRDVGTMTALPWETVEGIVRIVDGHHRPLDPRSVLKDPVSPLSVVISVASACSPLDRRLAPAVADYVKVEVGVPFALHGVPPGRCHLRLDERVDWPSLESENDRLLDPPVETIMVPESGSVTLDVVVETTMTAFLRLSFPPGIAPFRCEALLLNKLSGRVFRVGVRPPRESGVLEATERLEVTAGEYSVLVHSMSISEPGSDANFFAEAHLSLDGVGGATCDLVLEPGARVSGVALGPDGSPKRGQTVAFGWAPWTDGERPDFPYKARCDAEGRFTLRGLPPSRLLIPQFSAERVPSPRAHEESAATIRFDR